MECAWVGLEPVASDATCCGERAQERVVRDERVGWGWGLGLISGTGDATVKS